MLAGVFARGEVRDPDLADVLITVTEVRIGPDLKHATAFVTRLGRSDIAEKLPALRRAAPFLRGQVAKALRLRLAPDLSFQADTSIDYAMHVDSLLRVPRSRGIWSRTEPRRGGITPRRPPASWINAMALLPGLALWTGVRARSPVSASTFPVHSEHRRIHLQGLRCAIASRAAVRSTAG